MDGGGSWQSVGVTNSHVFTGLPNGVAVSFEVRAHNEAGWGPSSGQSAPVTPDTEPDRPAAPTVTFGDRSLSVSWSTPTNQGSAILHYELEIGGGASGVQQLGAINSYTWANLQNGVSYQFRVTAINAAGRSEPSAWSAPEHPLREPDAPAAPAVVQGDKFLDLSWAQPNNNGDTIIQFQVEMVSQPGAPASTTGTTFRWSNLPNGTTQQFRVRAKNRDVDWGAVECGVRRRQAVRRARHPGRSGCDSWRRAGSRVVDRARRRGLRDHRLRGAHQHRQPELDDDVAHVHRADQRHVVHVHRAGEEQRRVERVERGVRGGRAGRCSRRGRRRSPPKVSGVGAVDLTWPAAQANGATIGRYEVSVNNGAGRDVGNGTSYRYPGLANSTTYSFKVRACNDVGCGVWSAVGLDDDVGRTRSGRHTLAVDGRDVDRRQLERTRSERQRDRPLRRRHRPGRVEERGRPLDVVGRAEPTAAPTGCASGRATPSGAGHTAAGRRPPCRGRRTSTSPRAPTPSARPAAAAAATRRVAGSTSPPPGSPRTRRTTSTATRATARSATAAR